MSHWAASELALLHELYQDVPASDIAALLDRPVGQIHQTAARHRLKKSAAFFASDASGRVQRGQHHPNIVASRFKPGLVPWNAGRKGWVAPGTEATRFKPGGTPPNRQEVGALRSLLEDYAGLLEVLPARTVIDCHRKTERRIREILLGKRAAHDVEVIQAGALA